MQNKISISKDNFSLLLLCAFRYALGRRTYITSFVAERIRDHVNDLTNKDKEIIIEEIQQAKTRHENNIRSFGDSCDEETWISLLEFLQTS